jgi:hypothetical protein
MREWAQRRYGATVILMITLLRPDPGIERIQGIRPELQTIDDVLDELHVELLNAVAFSSDQVLRKLSKFIREPSLQSFGEAVAAMRKNLWGKSTSLSALEMSEILEVAQGKSADASLLERDHHDD